MRKILIITLSFLLFSNLLYAQTGQSAFAFLRLPASPYISALGGTNISVISEDNANAYQNPALLARITAPVLSLSYMNYVADINMGSAFFSKAASKRAVWGVGMIYANYGNFTEATETNDLIGTFGAKDMALHGVYSYRLTERWSGGITGKAIYSSFVDYNSFALGVDLGLNYYNENENFSASLAVKNIGGQIVKYTNEEEEMPWDVQLGFSKKLAHAPFRLHITGKYLNVWDLSLYRESTNTNFGVPTRTSDSFLKTFSKHLVFGLDFLPAKNFYLAFGYNPKVADDFVVMEQKGFYGFTIGTGFNIKRYRVSASMFEQHIGGTTLMIGVSTDLKKL